jgi:hypothetical protein
MRLNGWNYIPHGYGMSVDIAGAPRWLRLLFRTPFLDRFAYPALVRRGHAWLTPGPTVDSERDAVPAGWQVRPESESRVPLRPGRAPRWASDSADGD